MKTLSVYFSLILLFGLFSCENKTVESSKDSSLETEQSVYLSSWNESKAKNRIMEFVGLVIDTTKGSFVPPQNRIAVFDNDGTLWSEQPLYFKLFFALYEVKAKAADHPEWYDEEPMKSVLSGDSESLKNRAWRG